MGNQKFIMPANGVGNIRWAADTDKCLDVKGGSTDDGTPIQLYDCGNHNLNRIFKVPSSDTSGEIRWIAHPKRCMDVLYGKTEDETPIQMFTCGEGNSWAHQQFKISYLH